MNSKPKKKPRSIVKELKRSINKKISKYSTNEITYKIKILRDILYNEKSHLVASFKDFLIFDDCTEFLKRFYTCKESSVRLTKLFDFYEINSKIFPNYIILNESRYIYKNIQRKQKLIDYLQYLERKTKDKKLEKPNKKNVKLFNSTEYESIMKQSYFSTYENKDNDKQDVSASVDNLIEAIDRAERNIKSKNDENNSNLVIIDESGSKKQTPKINKNNNVGNYGSMNEDMLNSYLHSFKNNNHKIVFDKLKSEALIKDNSKIISQSNAKNNGNEIKEKANAYHSKVFSMPKLTINNNVVNNITVINNNCLNGKTITTCNKNVGNEMVNNLETSKKNELSNNLNIINQKYTRNINNNIIGNQNTLFMSKNTNTLDIAKEILNTKKFTITNFTLNRLPSHAYKVEPSINSKNYAPMTNRVILGLKGLSNMDNNYQTIDVNIQKNVISNNLNEDLNHLIENKKLKLIKIQSSSSQKDSDSKRSISVIKIPLLKNKNNIRSTKNEPYSIKRQFEQLPNYPFIKDSAKNIKAFSERGNISNTLRFLKNNK